MSTYRSPGGPSPPPPCAVGLGGCPWVPPAGTSTLTERTSSTVPEPAQVGQGAEMVCPDPPHRSQVVTVMTEPSIPRRATRTAPPPPHVEQVFLVVPGAAPSPTHTEHSTRVRNRTSVATPKAASDKATLAVTSTSRPRRGPASVRSPPNRPLSPKTERSRSSKDPKPEKRPFRSRVSPRS